ncbi:hypothetical protein BDR03DRAFT_883586, partial [Suillus americanus]
MELSKSSPPKVVDLAVQPVRLSRIASKGSILADAHISLLEEITALSGPNGHIDFLTCGINESGWNPPLIKIESIVTVDLSAVAYRADSAFANCKDFISTFEKYGSRYGIPAILLASFAMQESSCKPSTVGGAGEQGLMQLTSDK